MAQLWARWLLNPCRLGDPLRFRKGPSKKWPTCGQGGYVTPAASGVPSASQRGAESEVATCGQGGYLTPAASGISSASDRGAESEVAHLWARWLRNPCRLGDPLRFRAGGRIRSGPLVGRGGYLTPAASGIPIRFIAGGRIRSGPLVGKVAT